MKKHLISFTSIILLVIMGKLFISSATDDGKAAYGRLFENRYKVFALNLPDELNFAGERVPLEQADVRERFDREIHVNVYWQSHIFLLTKRANRYFPIIRPILAKYGIPDDFKYLPLVESGFVDMVSEAGAEGPWQFLAASGREYGLDINGEVDERYHLERATEAACRMLNESYRIFGSWTLAAAAYNCGPTALRNQLILQEVNNYYDLALNTQTARYVPRMSALKEIMENPGRYGLQYKKYHLYDMPVISKVEVDSAIPSLTAFAKKQGINYKLLKLYNPWLKKSKLTNKERKKYVIYIPKIKDSRTMELQMEKIEPSVPLPKEAPMLGSNGRLNPNSLASLRVKKTPPELYAVNPGEDLKFVANKFRVHEIQLMHWNHLDNRLLEAGQVLKIYRNTLEKR